MASNSSNNTHKPRMIYDTSSQDPRTSLHWEHLQHAPNDQLIYNSKELQDAFRTDIGKNYNSTDSAATEPQLSRIEGPRALALWSCIAGYIESLTTHKDPARRYAMYPIPVDALRRLVDEEFITLFLESLNAVPSSVSKQLERQQSTSHSSTPTKDEHHHRHIVQTLSNAIWSKVQSYSSSTTKDELHANSLYVCLRGYLDKRTLDCFGSAIVTIAGLQLLEAMYKPDDDKGKTTKEDVNNNPTVQNHFLASCKNLYPSFLTLSEDHAYESHIITTTPDDDNSVIQYGTCEMAIPGKTKQIREKRGKPIEDHFRKTSPSNGYRTPTTTSTNHTTHLTPETSWLYMRNNPIICTTVQMSIAAAMGNINCTIETAARAPNNTMTMTINASLCEMKRDLLWILYDGGYLSEFPFALIELGDCEEHCPSSRGNEWIYVPQLVSSSQEDLSKDTTPGACSPLSDTAIKESATILMNEQLFLEAIRISQTTYNDAQTYPYFYAGHYHKDAGRILSGCANNGKEEEDQEYRLVEALRLYAAASRVASRYTYDSKDSLQLIKHMTSVASLIVKDILSITIHADDDDDTTAKNATNNKKEQQGQQQPRPWIKHENAVAAATWLLAWLDSLLWWEEKKGQHFVEILNATHKHGIKKMFQLFSHHIRKDMMTHLFSSSSTTTMAITSSTKPHNIAKCDVYSSAITSTRLLYFQSPRSSRLAKSGLLIKALGKPKVMIGEMELTILSHDDSDSFGGGRRKRSRRNHSS